MKNSLPTVAIVGRPNVGKSSIFNRILRENRAIVYMEMGTTRDRNAQEASFEGRKFLLIDTGGFISEETSQMINLVKNQIRIAIGESDILMFVCDSQTGPLPQDFELAAMLRKAGKKIFLVVNKADNEKMLQDIPAFYELGLGEPFPVSALHDRGVGELLDSIVKEFPEGAPETDKQKEPIRVAVVGRPNVGKSSLLNFLLEEERVIVDEVPGTTRDTVDTYLKYQDTDYVLIDTAGIRHKRKMKEAVDVYSMLRTKEAIKKSAICVVLIDAYDGLRLDDIKILEAVLDEGKCCILCINKWDLVKGLPPYEYKEMIYKRAPFLGKYPMLFISAKTGHNMQKVLEMIKTVMESSRIKIPTAGLNKKLDSMKIRGRFTSKNSKLRIQYMTQVKSSPPKILVFVNDPGLVSKAHENFLENILRKEYSLAGVPVRFEFRSSKGGDE